MIAALLVFGIGCQGIETRMQTGQAIDLPSSEGAYTGSYLFDEWVYRGSDQNDHHLTYTWNVNNSVRQRNVVISREDIEVPGAFPLSQDRRQWEPVLLKFDSTGRLLSLQKQKRSG
jgi:hypothetical protein